MDFVDFDISPTSLLSGFRGLCGFRFLGSGIPTKRSVTEVTVFCGKLYTKKNFCGGRNLANKLRFYHEKEKAALKM